MLSGLGRSQDDGGEASGGTTHGGVGCTEFNFCPFKRLELWRTHGRAKLNSVHPTPWFSTQLAETRFSLVLILMVEWFVCIEFIEGMDYADMKGSSDLREPGM